MDNHEKYDISLLRFACASNVPRIPFKGKVQEMVRRFIITYKISRWTMVEENKNRLKSLADFTKWSRQNRKGLMQIAYYMTVSCIVYFITVVQ